MSNLIEYVIRIDKNGKEYGLKLNNKSGKFKRINLKYAKKREKGLIKERRYKKLIQTDEYKYIKNELNNAGYGGTYKEYKSERKSLIEQLKSDRYERNLKKSDKQIYNQASTAAFKFCGKKIITRYYFKYWCEGKICEYLCIKNGYYTSQYIQLKHDVIFNREIAHLKRVFNSIVRYLLLFNTVGKPYYNKEGQLIDDGINGGEVIMVKLGTNKIIKGYFIPQKIIDRNTILCDGEGNYIFKNKPEEIFNIDE
jgi:hypothetical protein